MAKGVVDGFEAVEVEEEDGNDAVGLGDAVQRKIEVLFEGAAVGGSGEPVAGEIVGLANGGA